MNMMTSVERRSALQFHPRRAGRYKALVRLLARGEIEDAIENLIARLDALHGDCDVEENGDEHDHTNAEDEDRGHDGGDALSGPGCSISDSADRAYTEWHTRGRHKVSAFGTEARDSWSDPDEDTEDDDADTGAEDHPRGFDPEEDACEAGDDRVISGPVLNRGQWLDKWSRDGWSIGDDADAERGRQPAETPISANEAWS